MRITTFNVFWLGTPEHDRILRGPDDEALLARVIGILDADAIVFQEIVNLGLLESLLQKASAACGRDLVVRNVDGRWLTTGRMRSRTSHIQKLALAYDRRGLAYSYSGRHERALANYTKAIELAPENPNPYNNRGWAYLELGRLDQALADLNHALELNPAHQLALENRLRLYMQTRRYTEAIKDGEAVLRINPDAAWAKERIAEARRASGTASASLAGPQLLSPADRSVFSHYPRDTVLKWAALPGAISYELQIDYQSDGKWSSETNGVAPVLRTNQTEYRFPFVGAQPGRWRVRALGIADEPGQWTEWRHFRYTR